MNAGDFRHALTVQTQTRTNTDGGGFTQAWAAIAESPWWCAIEPATAGSMERLAAGGNALLAQATHIMHGRYHSGITTAHRLVEDSRVFTVCGVQNVREDDRFTRVFAKEVES